MWPGDINVDGIVNDIDYVYLSAFNHLNNENGFSREKIDIQWYPHAINNWTTQVLDTNEKHADTDGNGKIDIIDFENINTNFKKRKYNYVPNNDLKIDHPDPLGLSLITNISQIDLADNSNSDSKAFYLNIILGDNENIIEKELVGLTFELQFDSRIQPFITSQNNPLDDEAIIELKDKNDHFINNIDPEKTKLLFTSTNHSVISEGSKLLVSLLKIEDTYTTQNLDGKDTLKFDLYNITAIATDGTKVDIGIRENQEVILYNVPINTTSNISDLAQKNLVTYPNPARDHIYIENPESIENGLLSIYKATGELIHTQQVYNRLSQIEIRNFEYGMYFISIKSINEIYSTRFIKL